MNEILHEYADFIAARPWDLYSTITFRQKRSDSIYWTDKIWSVMDKFGACRAFIASEPHRLEGIHFHVLSAHFDYAAGRESMAKVNTNALWKYCFKAFGRTTIEKIHNDQLAVSRYCAKYVVKGNNFDFKGPLW